MSAQGWHSKAQGDGAADAPHRTLPSTGPREDAL